VGKFDFPPTAFFFCLIICGQWWKKLRFKAAAACAKHYFCAFVEPPFRYNFLWDSPKQNSEKNLTKYLALWRTLNRQIQSIIIVLTKLLN
jgi:hypothetical protein